MDGSQFSTTSRDQAGIRHSFDRQPGPGASLFLKRDLSVQALMLPAEPSFDSADLSAARQAGFHAGHAEAAAAAATSQAQAQVLALGMIANALAMGQAEAARIADQAASGLARALVAALHAVMPDLIERTALSETGAMLAAVLPGLSRELTIRVEVPSEIAKGIEAAVAAMAAEYRDRIAVSCPGGLAAGDARVSWDCGHALRQPAQVWQSVMDLLEPALHNSSMKEQENGE